MLSATKSRRRTPLHAEAMTRVHDLLARRGVTGIWARVDFSDENGPRGGAAIRCALTVAPRRAVVIRAESTALTAVAAFNGALTIVSRQLTRRLKRRRRRRPLRTQTFDVAA